MRHSARRVVVASAVMLPVVVLSACSSGGDKASSVKSTTTTTSKFTPLPQQLPVVSIGHAVVEDPAGKPTTIVDVRGSVIIVHSDSDLLTTSMPAQGRRRYTLSGNDVFEVRSRSDGFGVVDVADGETKWTIRTTTNSLTVRKGEKRTVYTVTTPTPGVVAVQKGSKRIGTIERQPNGSSMIKAADGTLVGSVSDGVFSASYGTVLMTDLPVLDRAVVMAELLAAKK